MVTTKTGVPERWLAPTANIVGWGNVWFSCGT